MTRLTIRVLRLAVTLLSVGLNQSVLAEPGDALAAYRRGDETVATAELKKLQQLADDPGVLVLLDELFVRYRERLPKGGRPPAELVRAMARLVEGGPPQAQFQIYDLSRDGADRNKGIVLLEKAARSGYAEAQYDFLREKKSELPAADRVDWLLKTANGGSLRAKLVLAARYEASFPSRLVPKLSPPIPLGERDLVPISKPEAFRLFVEVARAKPRSLYSDDSGVIRRGKSRVARAHYYGIDAPVNYDAAFKWANSVGEEDLLLDLGNGDAVHIGNLDQNNSVAISSFEFTNGNVLSTHEQLARRFDLEGTDGDDRLVAAANDASYEDQYKGRAA